MAHFSCNYEIIIVDNGSLDNTEDLVKEFPIKYIRYDRPLGFSLPNNIGAKHASGDYLLFMNNDIEVYEDIFLSLAKGFKKDVELVGCHAAVLKENEFGILTHVGQVYDMKDQDSYLEGWCVLIKKKVFNKKELGNQIKKGELKLEQFMKSNPELVESIQKQLKSDDAILSYVG